MSDWQGLSEVPLETVYIDYMTHKEIHVVRRTIMNHVIDEFVTFLSSQSASGKEYRVVSIKMEIDISDPFVRRLIYLAPMG